MRKIAMGYEAVGFGRDMSPRFNIVVGKVGWAMFRWEADACRCVRQSHGAMVQKLPPLPPK